MGLENPAAESLESPAAENEITWKKATDQTGFAYSGKNSFKSGEGEFTVLGQGDSFAGSHAYLLLADVPGEKANSGTTLTARDSSGKTAFVATETRTGGEQEVAVGAGSQVKTAIDQAGRSEFLQLASLAKRKINFGSIELEWPGGSPLTNEATITHGLGTTPVYLSVQAGMVNMCGVGSPGGTTFKARMRTGDGTSPGAGTRQTVYWIAIG